MKHPTVKTALILLTFLTSGALFAGGSGDHSRSDTGTRAVLPEGHPLVHWRANDSIGDWYFEIGSGNRIFLIDSLGNRLELKELNSFVITSAGAIETFYMIGAEDRISAIGTSRAGIWPEDKTADLPSVGNLARPSFEKIIAAEPDLAIINGMNSDLAQQLTAVGIPVLVHNPGSIEEIINSILVLGILSGTKEKAVELVSERWGALQKIQNELNEEPLNLKGAFVYALEPLQAFSAESLPGEILKILGVSNIAASTSGERPILTTEYILQQNPDFLFGAMSINNEKDLLNANSAITKTRAGQEKNIFIIPSQLILRPSPRIIDALSMLHEKLKEIGPASTDGEAD